MQRTAIQTSAGATSKRLSPCVAPKRTLVVVRGLQRKADDQTQQQQGLGVARAPDVEISEPSTSGREKEQLSAEPVVEKGLPYLAVAGVAGMGVAETAYLTLTKLIGSAPVCPISGCETVLNSSYSELFGIPLSFLGMLAYGTVAGVAVAAAQQKTASQDDKEVFNKALAAGATLLAGVSCMLLYILQTRFTGDTCVWCYGSAALSFTLLGLVGMSMPPRQLASAAGPGLGALASAVLVFYMAFGMTEPSTADDFELPYSAPLVTEKSSSQAVTLAKRLKKAGARMYGAFWCSHCFDQKQVFGKEAMADFPYVECYPDGWKKGVKVVDACDTAGIRAFPTWIINGRVTEGQLTLEALEAELRGETIEVKQAPKSPFADS